MRVIHHPEGYIAIDRQVARVGDAVTNAVARDARKLAPKRTNQMASTIRVTRVGPLLWFVSVGTDHWHYMEYGTLGRDPVIRPRVKQALWWQGLPHPIAVVTKHPGNKAEPFMRPAVYQRRGLVVSPTGAVSVT